MAWSTLPTYTSGTLTPAMLNAIKDNILETAAAKATTAGRIFVASGVNTIAERVVQQNYDASNGTVASTSFVNLSGGGGVGPTVGNVTTGPLALVIVQAQVNNSTNGASSRMSYEINGATTSSATDDRGLLDQNTGGYDNRYATLELQALTAGVNGFTPKYRVSSGLGSFSARTCIVMAL